MVPVTDRAPESATEEVLARAHAFRERPTPELCRAIRRAKGRSLEEVGAALGVTGVTVGRWEKGERTPRGELLVRYVNFLRRLEGI